MSVVSWQPGPQAVSLEKVCFAASGWAPGMGVGVGSDQTDRTKMRLPERVCRFKARAQLGLPAQPHRLTWGVPGARLQKQHRVAVTPSPAPCPRQAEPGPLKGATLTPTCCPRGQTAGTLCPRPSWRTVSWEETLRSGFKRPLCPDQGDRGQLLTPLRTVPQCPKHETQGSFKIL